MPSEKVSSQFKASEMHKDTKHSIKRHMVLKLEYRKNLLENFPWGQKVLSSLPRLHFILQL